MGGRTHFALFFLLLTASRCCFALYLNGLFTDNAILQMARPEVGTPQARLYGTADVSETVKISGTNGFPSLTTKPTGAESGEGNWSVTVEPPEGKQGELAGMCRVCSTAYLDDDATFNKPCVCTRALPIEVVFPVST